MLKKVVSGLSAAVLAASVAGISVSAAPSKGGEMRDITTMQLVKDMGIGINLGNTFEAIRTDLKPDAPVSAFETGWGSVEITEEIINGMASEGIETLRIPVAWSNKMVDDGTYTVSGEYLARVQQVADWALDAGMYVVINEHWDGGWLNRIPTDENLHKKYLRIWEQVADHFKDYGDHLIFESQNEEWCGWADANGNPIYWDRWSGEKEENGKQKSFDLMNQLNQEFVDIVRNSGGNNGERHLLISGPHTDIELTCDDMFKMPNDPANRMAVSVHYYTPWNYASETTDSDWGDVADYQELNKYMDMMEDKFVENGVPVIIGECCNATRMSEKKGTSARDYMTAVCEAAYSRNMCPVLWDITYADDGSAKESADNQVYNRRTCKMQDQVLKDNLNAIVENDKKKAEITVIDSKTVDYKSEAFDLGATVNSGAAISYTSSNEKVATVDSTGKVTVVGSGEAQIYMFAESTDGYTAACAATAVTVNKLQNPPTTVADTMTVGKDIESTDQIELPEGWKWLRRVNLPMDTPTKARAIYTDTNYINRAVDVMITRTDDTVSSSDVDSSSGTDTSSNDSTASSSQSSSSSSSSKNSSAANSSKANSSAANSSKSNTTDTNPATGAGAAGLAAVVLAMGALVVSKKNKQ